MVVMAAVSVDEPKICLLTCLFHPCLLASAVTVKYPSINGSETLNCECPDHQCQKVYWYRLLKNRDTPEFLMHTDVFNKANYAKNVEQNRFKTAFIDSTKGIFTLRITGIQEKDAGFYACLLISHNSAQDPKDLMPEGYSIRPGGLYSLVPPLHLPILWTIMRTLLMCSMAL